jgi:S-adenosylmethionine synthetase
MESEWELDRIELYRLWQEHPDWSKPRLAEAVQRSLSWVKKWLKRFGEATHHNLKMFCSLSRAPQHHTRRIVKRVRDAILQLRATLHERYHRS